MAPLEIVLVIIFLWKFVKYIVFIAVGYTLLLLSIQIIFGRLASDFLYALSYSYTFLYNHSRHLDYRTKILQLSDERIKMVSEIVKSMRIIKMYCWESTFNERLRRVRK